MEKLESATEKRVFTDAPSWERGQSSWKSLPILEKNHVYAYKSTNTYVGEKK